METPQTETSNAKIWHPKYFWPTITHRTCPRDEYNATLHGLLQSARSRHIENRGIYQAEAFIENELKNDGKIQTFQQNFTVLTDPPRPHHVRAVNIIGFLQGTTNDFFLVGAHHDTMPKGSDSQGVDDNGSGTVDMLETAKIMANIPIEQRRLSIVFASFSAEEEGMRGSQAFVESSWFQQRKENFTGALILDQLGTDLTQENFVFETKNVTGDAEKQVDWILSALAAVSQKDCVVDYNAWGSDHMPFLDNNHPAVLVISGANRQTAAQFGHTERDNIEHFNATFATHACSLVSTTVSLLASVIQPTEVTIEQTSGNCTLRN